LQPALRCIRCGACMNHCPVYQNIGGQAYGWVYPGPIGAILTPAYLGLDQARDLPQAATLCGACEVVCPVRIPLPALMRELRQQSVQQGLRPWRERLGVRLWHWLALHPRSYRWFSRVLIWGLSKMANAQGMVTRLPGLDGWTQGRDMPAPQGASFHSLYRKTSRKTS
jgi:L-lactate dehydrogenase complex protein LldF